MEDIRTELARKSLRRQLEEHLHTEEEVSKFTVDYLGFHINFRDGTSEFWILDEIHQTKKNHLIPDDPWKGPKVPIRNEYLYNSLDDNAKQMERLFRIDFRQWRVGSFWEQRLSIHRLVYRLIREGWVPIAFHQNDLLSDLRKLTESSLKRRHVWDGQLHVYGKYGSSPHPGRMLLEQFTDWGEQGEMPFSRAWREPTLLFRTIKNLLRRKNDVTRHSMLCHLAAYRGAGINYTSPNAYRALLKLLSLSGYVVADPNPGFGSKAIAATLEGCQYCTNKDFVDLAQFLGTRFYKLERDHYDCVLLDYNWRDSGERVFEDLKHWEPLSDVRAIYVPRDRVKDMPKPDKYVRIQTRHMEVDEPDFVFYYV